MGDTHFLDTQYRHMGNPYAHFSAVPNLWCKGAPPESFWSWLCRKLCCINSLFPAILNQNILERRDTAACKGNILPDLGPCTICPRSSDPSYIVTYHIKWVTTSWTHSIPMLYSLFNLTLDVFGDTKHDLDKIKYYPHCPVEYSSYSGTGLFAIMILSLLSCPK